MTTVRPPPPPVVDPEAVESRLLDEVVPCFERIDDPAAKQVATTLRDTLAEKRSSRPVELVVVGETKAGKSTLINGLIGRPRLAPVDSDVATNVRLAFTYDPAERALVYLSGHDEPVEVAATGKALLEYASEEGNPLNERGVLRIEVGIDSPLLEEGLVLIDTPGACGTNSAHDRVVLEALKLDGGQGGLLFVIRADHVIGQSELAFLGQAADTFANVTFAITKTDLKEPGWREVLEENRGVVSRVRLLASRPFFPLRSRDKEKADEAHAVGDSERAEKLEERSGYRELAAYVRNAVIAKRRLNTLANLAVSARAVAAKIEETNRTLAEPVTDSELDALLAAATEELNQFNRRATRRPTWQVELAEAFNDLQAELIDRDVRSRVDEITTWISTQAARAERDELLRMPAETEARLQAAVLHVQERLMTRIGEITAQITTKLAVPPWHWRPDAPAIAAAMTSSAALRLDAAFEQAAFKRAAKRDWTKFLFSGGGGAGVAATLFGAATGGIGMIVGVGLAVWLTRKNAPVEALRAEVEKRLAADVRSYRSHAELELRRRLRDARKAADSQLTEMVSARTRELKADKRRYEERKAESQEAQADLRGKADRSAEDARKARLALEEIELLITASVVGRGSGTYA